MRLAVKLIELQFHRKLREGTGRSEAMRQIQLEMLKDPQRRHPFLLGQLHRFRQPCATLRRAAASRPITADWWLRV